MIKITIYDKEIEVLENITILEAAKRAGIDIPTLCHLNLHNVPNVNKGARCRICVVEVEGRDNLIPACSASVTEGMVIKTDSEHVKKARRTILDLLLSDHDKDCDNCYRNNTCELQALCHDFGIEETSYSGKKNNFDKDKSSFSIKREPSKCILCGRCETMCNTFQTVGVFSKINRGFNTKMAAAFDKPLMESPCTFCGQCVSVCPTAALREIDNTKEVMDVLNSQDKYVIVQTAPAIRVALGEVFGLEAGTDVTGKMIAALRQLGFKKVFDTNFAADLTVMEETHEFLQRLENNGPLPILTSCCPAWVKFVEQQFPNLLHIPSTCKSPHEMFGRVAKTYLVEKLNIDPQKIVVVSIMPCLAKKYEAQREELQNNGLKDVDYVLSTRELSKMIREQKIDFIKLADEQFDSPLGESSGGATIFGVTGGVIEAVVRNASYILDKDVKKIDFTPLRGMDGIREATVTINNKELKIAIAHGLKKARTLLENIEKGSSNYHAIEIMACRSGCIGGGGQPYFLKNNDEILKKRSESLYKIDQNKDVRISSLNKEIQTLYSEFLEQPGSHKAHDLLHTTFNRKDIE